ncbi:hypothetical protein PV08_08346 [Exophiala spinifera]|uniref:Metallo-beta-lactamase domain-containing protein n=1 Tax=Exophiala spinifera TaxID=91928 RepID=A0A0D2BPW2_9EURO|nr:uncharacterized protein PV08_08346 [Exophiala spinifera]KIW13159.1 hypothetical protein PV08_08346 [Exophiala spinifera]
MASKLFPGDPEKVLVIRDIPNTPITTLSVPFLRFGRIKFGGRATLVKLQTGDVAVFSPVALTSAVKAKVNALGPIKYIIAPDVEHHLLVETWAKEYPEAELFGPEGLPEKHPGLKFSHVYTAKVRTDMPTTAEFDKEFSSEYFPMHPNKELVFYHRPTRTMIEADLLFNLPATEQFSKSGVDPKSGLLTKLFGGIMNTRGDMVWQKRFLWYAASKGDRAGFAESVKKIKSSWDVERIIPCHGDVIETGGKAIFDKAMAWFYQKY